MFASLITQRTNSNHFVRLPAKISHDGGHSGAPRISNCSSRILSIRRLQVGSVGRRRSVLFVSFSIIIIIAFNALHKFECTSALLSQSSFRSLTSMCFHHHLRAALGARPQIASVWQRLDHIVRYHRIILFSSSASSAFSKVTASHVSASLPFSAI